MNDGAAAYRDLSMRSNSITYEFISNAWRLFTAIRTAEIAAGHPGARMVIAPGFRMLGRRAGIDQTAGHFASIMRRFQAGELPAEQAIREASRISRSFDVIPQLQANFAFTKAYVAENGGSAAGLPGPNCYVDIGFFTAPPPPWIDLGPAINWRDDELGLTATFAAIRSMRVRKHHKAAPDGVRSGLDVGRDLGGGSDVLSALRLGPRLSRRVLS
jgi:hypothetical protein